MHPATSRNKPPGWRGAVGGILVVVLVSVTLTVVGIALAATAVTFA